MTADILRIKEPFISDESIFEYEYLEYNPIVGTNLYNSGDITITIELQDSFYHPSESYLIIEGQLVKNDNANTPYGNADVITLTNNGLMYLFKNIRYDLSEKQLENIQYPGQASTMLGLLKYPDDFSKSQGMNQLWYKDTNADASKVDNIGFKVRQDYIIQRPNPKGTFSFRIPLKHIFGFCEDYTKIIYGLKHTLTLTRNNNNDAIFRANATDAGKVILHKISWFMPKVIPSDNEKMEILKIIEKKEKIPVAYRMIQCAIANLTETTFFQWRLSAKSAPEVPRFIVIGFQTAKINNQEQNPAIFDHINVSKISVSLVLNSIKYPKTDYRISFDKYCINLVESMAMQQFLDQSFTIFHHQFQTLIFFRENIKIFILYFLLMFQSKLIDFNIARQIFKLKWKQQKTYLQKL